MNVSARMHPLIICIGNPLRSDDGLGWVVAEQLSRESNAGLDIRSVYQLTPDLAQWMAAVNLVIMIDVSHEGEPGELRIRSLSSNTQQSAVGTHYSTPDELAAFTEAIYGHCPPIMVVTLTGADFSIGERLSSIVAQKIPSIRAVVCKLSGHELSV